MPNALVIVAHHDDHVLWMGGTIQRMTTFDWNWTVMSMCVSEPTRIDYFNKSCNAYGVKAINLHFQDYQADDIFSKNDQDKMESQLQENISGNSYEWIFTHTTDPQCEYGRHANHLEVASVTTSLVSEGKLGQGLDKLAYFSYNPIYGGNGRATVARIGADSYLQLTYDELCKKLDWCNKVPDIGNLQGIGYPCPNPEAFKSPGLKLPSPFIGN